MRTDLIEARRAAGMTQQQLAEAIGKDQGSISRYESGATEPDKDVAMALARALGIDVLAILYPEQPLAVQKPKKSAA